MKILVLEDNKDRIDIFREKLEQEGVEVTFTDVVAACIHALNITDWDILFLDHDYFVLNKGSLDFIKNYNNIIILKGDKDGGYNLQSSESKKWQSLYRTNMEDAE